MAYLNILIPWKDRNELPVCLAENHAFFEAQTLSASFIIINCGGDKTKLNELIGQLPNGFPLRVVHLAHKVFNKSLALNTGIAHTKAPWVMVLDTDVILKEFDGSEIKEALNNDSFVTLQKVYEQQPVHNEFPEADHLAEIAYHIEFKDKDGRTAIVEMNREGLSDSSRAAPGMLVARLEHLQEVGGYNSELVGWGWEDLDMIVRLQWVLSLKRHQTGSAMHMTHDDSLRAYDRTLGSKKANEQQNFHKCLINYRLGLLDGTLKEDIQATKQYITEDTIKP